jgi:FKBP-type peptidyl-prolyl cis-trans isomerase
MSGAMQLIAAAVLALATPAVTWAAPAPAAVVVQSNGVRVIDTKLGTGTEAQPGSLVVVHYTGWIYQDGGKGKQFDTSRTRGNPFVFTVGGSEVIEGWDTGLVGMKVGGTRTLIIPPAAGYGERGAGSDIGPNATLIFEIELLEVQ